jgi:BirA family biotin operon repressor/biotin-[acetyl-CoA-carboxylase] ligase
MHVVTSAVALSAAGACRDVAGVEVELKWPNDLLAADGRKVAGVLAESDGTAVVVGIGLNVNWGDDVPDGAVALNHLAGHDIDRRALLDALLDGLASREGRWDDVMAEYRTRCATVGRRVRVTLADGEIVGTAVDIEPSGALVIDDEAGSRRTVTVGDVVHLRGS